MKLFKKAAAILFSCTMLAAAAVPFTAAAETKQSTEVSKMELKFDTNGEFKILLLADTQDTDEPQKEMLEIINNTLDSENPDLVIFLGDNTCSFAGATKEKTATAMIDYLSR